MSSVELLNPDTSIYKKTEINSVIPNNTNFGFISRLHRARIRLICNCCKNRPVSYLRRCANGHYTWVVLSGSGLHSSKCPLFHGFRAVSLTAHSSNYGEKALELFSGTANTFACGEFSFLERLRTLAESLNEKGGFFGVGTFNYYRFCSTMVEKRVEKALFVHFADTCDKSFKTCNVINDHRYTIKHVIGESLINDYDQGPFIAISELKLSQNIVIAERAWLVPVLNKSHWIPSGSESARVFLKALNSINLPGIQVRYTGDESKPYIIRIGAGDEIIVTSVPSKDNLFLPPKSTSVSSLRLALRQKLSSVTNLR